MKGIRTRIAGFQHHPGANEALMKVRVGERFLLVPEPENPHDKNAVAVTTTRGKMLGYVPAVDAPGVLERLKDRDTLVRCEKTSASFNSIAITYQTGDPLQ